MTSREFDSSVCNKTVCMTANVGSCDPNDYEFEPGVWLSSTEGNFARKSALNCFKYDIREMVMKGAPLGTHYADDIERCPDFHLPSDVLGMYRIADLREAEKLPFILQMLFKDELSDMLTLAKMDKHPDDLDLEWYQKRYYHFVCVRD